jgi:hypothetical protein
VSGQLHAPAAIRPGMGDWVGPRADLVTAEKIYIYILADPANVVLPYKLFLGNFLV